MRHRTRDVTNSPDILAHRADGIVFVMRGIGCVREPVARFASLEEARAWPELQRG